MPIAVPVFQKFHVEAAIIGQLVIGYGELELDLCNCVAMGIGNVNKTVKAMFGTRSETKRINIAETLARQPYKDFALGDWSDEAIIGMRYCVQIRNQYAHRNFYENSLGKLAFVNLEELAQRNKVANDYLSLAIRYVTPTLLEEQEQYFVYVRER